jgi:hypothetical protein
MFGLLILAAVGYFGLPFVLARAAVNAGIFPPRADLATEQQVSAMRAVMWWPLTRVMYLPVALALWPYFFAIYLREWRMAGSSERIAARRIINRVHARYWETNSRGRGGSVR